MQLKELLKKKLFFRYLSLFFAVTTSVILFLFLGLLRENKAYKKLAQADNLFIYNEELAAFEKYKQLPSWLSGDTLVETRLALTNKEYSTDPYFACSDESLGMLLEAIEACGLSLPENQTDNSLDSLVQLAVHCMNHKKELIITKREFIENSPKQSLLTIQRKKGDIVYFLGQVNADSVASGYGIGIYTNGNYYKGYWENNLRHGQGELYFKNGEVYVGDFYEDNRQGFGTFKFRNQDYYTGGWKDNMRDGWGTVISRKGDTIVDGFWERDRHNRRVQRESSE